MRGIWGASVTSLQLFVYSGSHVLQRIHTPQKINAENQGTKQQLATLVNVLHKKDLDSAVT